ncbi:hypothetical protein ANANG_G00036020 [Anguilla anguilla]|uniref:Apolipoprotein M n=1 Tax=Anguilla anguilla TaxID=7936 RepID=A0A9D3MUD8_ANGAN|nr:hypothetical protein ANANG_G00036020 [Anguilla anguilla]
MYLRIAAVLGLLSVSTAGPLPCEDVVRPLVLEDFSSILGKWIVIEATVDSQKYAALLKTVNSAWVEILPTYHNNTAIFNKANMINGVCSYSPTNISISDSVVQFTMEGNMTGNSTATFLRTCADCLVMKGTSFLEGHIVRTLHIFGRTGKLSDFDRKTYRRQVECLGLPQPNFIHNEKQELCPQAGLI